MAEIETKSKGNNAFKYILTFILFLAIGIAGGYFGMNKYQELKDDNTETVVDDGPEDITNLDEYQDLIAKLYDYVDGYSLFYTTEGIEAKTLSNENKLAYLYAYLKNDSKVTDELLPAEMGANNCLTKFALDDSTNIWSAGNTCTTTKVEINLMTSLNKSLFGDENIDTIVDFINNDSKLCTVNGEYYVCGTQLDTTSVTGSLDPKFTITKVTKDEGTIVIYDKGYLLDTRSTVVNPEDGHDKYILHSSNSTDYSYELKNADNLTFKHTFKTDDRVNYYYVSSEVVKNEE